MLQYFKCRDVKSPERRKGDAGFDFFVPKDFNAEMLPTEQDRRWAFNLDGKYELNSGCDLLIPSGLHVRLPVDHVLMLADKSGVATRKKLMVAAKIIDESYQGEIHYHMVNFSNGIILISPGEKIIQGLLIRCNYMGSAEISSLEKLYKNHSKSHRGSGGFGSTGSY